MLIIILILNIFSYSNEYSWKKYTIYGFEDGIQVSAVIKKDNLILAKWHYGISDPNFFNLIVKEVHGVSLSIDNGINWKIIKETSWELDKENPIESDKMKDTMDIAIGLKILGNNNLLFIMKGGYVLKTEDFGETFDTTRMGIDSQFNDPIQTRSGSFYNRFNNENNKGLIYYADDRYNILDKIYLTKDNAQTWEKIHYNYSDLNSEIPKEEARLISIDYIKDDSYLFYFIDDHVSNDLKKKEYFLTEDNCKTFKKIQKEIQDGEEDFRMFGNSYEELYLSGYYLNHNENIDYSPYLYRSVDKGGTWKKIWEIDKFSSPIVNIYFLNESEFIFITQKEVYRTTDNGITFNTEEVEDDSLKTFSYISFDYVNNAGLLHSFGAPIKIWEMTKTSSVEINSMNHYFSVYPNPVNNNEKVYLEFEKDFPVSIDILDFNGKLINNHQYLEIKNGLFINNLSKGVYFIKANYSDQSIMKKFVIE